MEKSGFRVAGNPDSPMVNGPTGRCRRRDSLVPVEAGRAATDQLDGTAAAAASD
jgi:hypothetical protein